jgi:hypothetical protein
MATTYRGTTQTAAGIQTNPAFSATQQLMREVFDRVKMNVTQNTKICALIAEGEVGDDGLKTKPGMISKWEVKAPRFESYNYNQFPATVTVATALSSTTLVVDDTTYLKTYDTLFNTTNRTMCRIDAITNTTTIEITSVGTTAFDAAVGEVLLIGPTAYPEYSSAPSMLTKDFDNVYNTLQISREPVGISGSMLKSEFYATGDYFTLLKAVNLVEFYRKIDRGLIFGARASGSGNTTSGGSALTSAFRTSRGLITWASDSYNMDGNMTLFKLRTSLPKKLYTVQENQRVIAMGGFETLGRINELFNDQIRYVINDAKTPLKEFGTQTTVVRTINMPIEFVRHEAYDQGDLQKAMILFVPDNLRFAYLKDRGVRPVVGLQNNDVDGKIDSIEAEYGLATIDGGASILRVDNCW